MVPPASTRPPPNALNKLVGNANGTWTENANPMGSRSTITVRGKLATIKRASDTWTITYERHIGSAPHDQGPR